jgi:hypothetical protein
MSFHASLYLPLDLYLFPSVSMLLSLVRSHLFLFLSWISLYFSVYITYVLYLSLCLSPLPPSPRLSLMGIPEEFDLT